MAELPKHAFGWLPDPRDDRDYTLSTPEVAAVLNKIKKTALLGCLFSLFNKSKKSLSLTVDLSEHFPPVYDQMGIGSCTAQSVCGLIQYFQKRAYGRVVNLSRLFVYKMARMLDELEGDTGAYLRTAMKSLALVGAPPEEYWPYTDSPGWDNEPGPFLYALGHRYSALMYYRLDRHSTRTTETLEAIKESLDAGLPCVGGFTVFSNYSASFYNGGFIPVPKNGDTLVGGHAVVIVGYDDTNKYLKIRNSWGRVWGDRGYGYLPYDYVLNGWADDFWSLVEAGFVDSVQFM